MAACTQTRIEDFKVRSKSLPSTSTKIACSVEGGRKVYRFPPGIFELDEQLLVPEQTSILGARDPNDWSQPAKPPTWEEQTLFLATRGVTDYNMVYCHAADMVTTRVGFVLSSYVTVRNVNYQGIDTIRPNDNGALCGGGAFETKGCAENSCAASAVNNGGSDGFGSVSVTIENVRLNDFFFTEDQTMVGALIPGNYDCKTDKWMSECCFCKPNGVRSTQADAINLHGYLQGALVESVYFENTGDDMYVVWGGTANPENVTFRSCTAVNPGIMRPNWYGNCVATYGLKEVTFDSITCRAPTPEHPILQPESGESCVDTSMFVFYTSFGGRYPVDNSITVKNWTFQDLAGKSYTPEEGSLSKYATGKMVWTRKAEQLAPFYLPNQQQQAGLAAQRAFMDRWGEQLEQMLQMCVVLVPVQEDDDDKAGFWSQAVYSLSDLFNLYRTVVLRSPEEIPVCDNPNTGIVSMTQPPSKELRRARLTYMLAAFALRALRSIQVLVEMDAFRRKGSKHALRVCFRLEIVKLVLKVFLRLRMPFSFYVDEVAIEDAEPPKLLEQRNAALLGKRDEQATESDAACAAAETVYVGRRTGRSLKALEAQGPGNGDTAPQPAAAPPARVAAGLGEDRTPNTRQIVVAEVLHHMRPLLHLTMLHRRGRKSWGAWLVAVLLDRISAGLLEQELRPKSGTRAAALELAEVRRRQNQVWWALLRSPMFDKLLRRPSEALDWVLKKIPVINMFNIVELALVLQPFYFSTSGS
ncbi:pex16 [Symbiodinium sp. KB8]|nr:pex16 [Symbiodinium sp. KB8]